MTVHSSERQRRSSITVLDRLCKDGSDNAEGTPSCVVQDHLNQCRGTPAPHAKRIVCVVQAPPRINHTEAVQPGVWERIRGTTHDEVVHRGPIIQEVGYRPDVTRCARFSEGRNGHPRGLNLRDTPGHIKERNRDQIVAAMGTW